MKEGWEIKTVRDVCDIINGKNQKQVESADGKYPIYGSGGIMGYATDFLCKAGSTIIGRKGTINRPLYVMNDFWNVDTAFGFQPKSGYDSRFLFYLWKSIDFTKYDKSVTIPSLVKSDLLKIEIPVPPLSEQQRIVSELDCISGIIEKKKQQLTELDNLAQAIFYDMFGDHSQWKNSKLKDITVKLGSGATPKGGNQSYKEEGISLIRSMNVHNAEFKYKDLAHIDELQAKALDNVTIQEGDILLNITGASVARCCIVPNDILPARVNQHVCIIRLKPTIANNVFLCYLLISNEYQEMLLSDSKSNAATRESLPKNLLEKLNVPLPPLPLQQSFAAKIAAIEEQKALIRRSIAETEALFGQRMDYYFN